MTHPTRDFKAAVVGGGMCGLLCGIGLVRAGIEVDVFESAPKFEEVGAGVGLGPNAIRALEGLGVLEAVLRRADEDVPTLRPFRFLAGVGEHEHVYDYPVSAEDSGLGIYRPAFLEALSPLIDPAFVHFGKRCISISVTTSGTHLLHFEDGSIHEADLIVGADGIKSVVRDFVVDHSSSSRLVYSNTVAYRAIFSAQSLKEAGVKTDLQTQPLCWLGSDKHIITFPVQAKQMINIVAFASDSQTSLGSVTVPPPWVHSASKEELLNAFAGWGADAITLLQQIKNPSKWFIHCMHPPLRTYVRQRVVLIGDAAHAMLPHLGAGVGQGFEDVFTLCKILGHGQTRAGNINNALEAYDSIRAPRANMVLQSSSSQGRIYEEFLNTQGDRLETQKRLAGTWEPVWHYDLAGEVATLLENMYEH